LDAPAGTPLFPTRDALTASTPATPGISRRAGLLLALLLVGANVLVFAPSLNRIFVSDQVLYMAELKGSRDFSDGIALCDYSLVRRYTKGDELLYRPLLFVWLAAENTLFGSDHVYWNAANLVLHCVVTLLLWGLLYSIQPSLFSFLFALIFSLLTIQVELVIWCHLGGYLWACIWMLAGLYCALKGSAPDATRRGMWLAGYCAAFSIGVFFYEIACIMALLTGVYVAFTLRRSSHISKPRLYAALAAPLLLYTLFYIPHFLNAPRLSYRAGFEDNGTARDAVQLITSVGGGLWRWTRNAFMPESIIWLIRPFERCQFKVDPWKWSNLILAPLLLLWASLISLPLLRKRAGLLALLALLLIGYVTMIRMGRPYSPSYYNYLFDLFGAVMIYCTIDFSNAARAAARKGFAAVLLIFAAISGYFTYATCSLSHEANLPEHVFLQEVERAVRSHSAEPSFSFAIDAPEEFNPMLKLTIGYLDRNEGVERIALVPLLYARHFQPDHPRYVLVWDAKAQRIVEHTP
jgi:hypothetical protein